MNHCFVGETMITTIDGLKRIDNIKIGDLVLTSKGYKPVLKVWDNGLKQVNNYLMQYDTFCVNLCSTKEHLIKTEEGWKQISQLQSEQMVYHNKHSQVKNITFTPMKNISQEVEKDYIQKCGNSTTEQSQKDFTFTMSIKPHGIAQSLISNLYKGMYILGYTDENGVNGIPNGLKSSKEKELPKLQNGTGQKKESNGTVNTEKEHGLIEKPKKWFAYNVEKNTQHHSQVGQNTVITTARLKHLEVGEETIQRVYDLFIEDCHEYFANGVLVHNCIDGIRYVALNKLTESSTGWYEVS